MATSPTGIANEVVVAHARDRVWQLGDDMAPGVEQMPRYFGADLSTEKIADEGQRPAARRGLEVRSRDSRTSGCRLRVGTDQTN